MYFINYFYVSVTDDAPKCPRAESPESSWPCAEMSRRRVGGAELASSHFDQCCPCGFGLHYFIKNLFVIIHRPIVRPSKSAIERVLKVR